MSDLIERYGYERAVRELKAMDDRAIWMISGCLKYREEVRKECLEYRREHNIYEVGDKVVHHKFSNIKIYEVCEISGDLLTVFYDRKTHSFKTDIRHATDAEIKAGRRL